MLTLLLGFLAGSLTSLSPCVLPALPIVMGSAAQRSRFAPLALAGGMVLSFTIVGVTLASAGSMLGVPPGALRLGAAILLVTAGVTMLSTTLQDWLAHVLAPLASRASSLAQSPRLAGIGGQFALGALLGVVWSPCTGPTLGAAVGLAAQAGGGIRAAVIMLAFGIGASLPLLAIAYASRAVLSRRATTTWIGTRGKAIFGGALTLVGVAILLGLDKIAEAQLLDILPAWWTDTITRF